MNRRTTDLYREFLRLRENLFGENRFVVLREDLPTTQRYSQLLGLFFPPFRTTDWVDPRTDWVDLRKKVVE